VIVTRFFNYQNLLPTRHCAAPVSAWPTQSAEDMFDISIQRQTRQEFAILAPNARDTTWDAITGGFGPDSTLLIARWNVSRQLAIDPLGGVGGFSDGASYAISLD